MFKINEEAIRYYAQVMENISDAIILTDINFKIISWNKASEHIYGWKKKDVVGKKLSEIIPIEFLNQHNEKFPPVLFQKSKWKGKTNQQDRNGYVINMYSYMNLIKNLDGDSIGIVFINKDITEADSIRRDLKQTKSMLLSLISNLVGIVYRCLNDKPRTMELLNKSCFDVTGYTPQELIHNKKISYVELIHEDDRDYVWNEIQIALEQKKPFQITYRIRNASGVLKWVLEQGRNVFLDGVIHNEGYILDITEQKEVEKKLLESVSFLNDVIEQCPSSILISDENGTLIKLNNACIKLFNINPEDIIGKYNVLKDILIKKQGLMPLVESVFNEGKTVNFKINYDSSHLKNLSFSSGFTNLILDAIIFPIKNEAGQITNVVIQHEDLTLKRFNEKKIISSEENYRRALNRADFYKDLFTHDINNLLQNIQSSAELLDFKLKNAYLSNEVQYCLNVIKDEVKRGANLTSNIRILSEIEKLDNNTERIEIIGIIETLVVKLKEKFELRRVKFTINTIFKKIYIFGNRFVMDLIENLMINSIKYNQRDLVKIQLKISKLEEDHIKFIKFELSDNGIGIRDEMKNAIFQRGYDEIQMFMGLGLGLVVVKKIIELLEGRIWVEDRIANDSTKGSNFIFLLRESLLNN